MSNYDYDEFTPSPNPNDINNILKTKALNLMRDANVAQLDADALFRSAKDAQKLADDLREQAETMLVSSEKFSDALNQNKILTFDDQVISDEEFARKMQEEFNNNEFKIEDLPDDNQIMSDAEYARQLDAEFASELQQ